MRKRIRLFVWLMASSICFGAGIAAPARAEEPAPATLIVFHSLSCHRCEEARHTLIPAVEKKFAGRIRIEYRDLGDVENYKLLLGLQEKHGVKMKNALPVFYLAGHFLGGEGDLEKSLPWLIEESLKGGQALEGLSPAAIDLVAHFKSFRPLAVASAGVIDGINPCAFTVIVFFMSFLALQGYTRRQLVGIGLVFILAVFLTYLLVGVGAFVFLYRLKGFWFFTRIFNFSVALLSIGLGCAALYDLFVFKKSGQAERLLLQLPPAVKNRIHAVIGIHYRSGKDGADQAAGRPMARLAVASFTTGFVVSMLELVCTGQVYLPTITFVLKTTPLKTEAFGFMVLYNFLFITPLLVIFLCALLGVSSQQFAGFLKRHLAAVKLLMALFFFTFAAVLLMGGI